MRLSIQHTVSATLFGIEARSVKWIGFHIHFTRNNVIRVIFKCSIGVTSILTDAVPEPTRAALWIDFLPGCLILSYELIKRKKKHFLYLSCRYCRQVNLIWIAHITNHKFASRGFEICTAIQHPLFLDLQIVYSEQFLHGHVCPSCPVLLNQWTLNCLMSPHQRCSMKQSTCWWLQICHQNITQIDSVCLCCSEAADCFCDGR